MLGYIVLVFGIHALISEKTINIYHVHAHHHKTLMKEMLIQKLAMKAMCTCDAKKFIYWCMEKLSQILLSLLSNLLKNLVPFTFECVWIYEVVLDLI